MDIEQRIRKGVAIKKQVCLLLHLLEIFAVNSVKIWANFVSTKQIVP